MNTPSQLFAAIKAHPLHTTRDIEVAAHDLAWGRVRDLTALAARVAARKTPDVLA